MQSCPVRRALPQVLHALNELLHHELALLVSHTMFCYQQQSLTCLLHLLRNLRQAGGIIHFRSCSCSMTCACHTNICGLPKLYCL